jgi:hypothetical protein
MQWYIYQFQRSNRTECGSQSDFPFSMQFSRGLVLFANTAPYCHQLATGQDLRFDRRVSGGFCQTVHTLNVAKKTYCAIHQQGTILLPVG